MESISLCMIVKNEEKNIAACLSSAKDLVDEIIIADTGSTDRTKQIAEEIIKNSAPKGKIFDLKIFDLKWNDDFSAARNECIKRAAKDWVLVLDADEELDGTGVKKIKDLIANAGDFSGFALEQKSYVNDFFEGARRNDESLKRAKGRQFYVPHFLVRLFRNGLGVEFRHRIHELAEDSMREKGLKFRKVDVTIHHFSSEIGREPMARKSDEYSRLIMKQLAEDPISARYNYQAARMFLGKNDLPHALKYFRKAAILNPRYNLVFSEIAKIYLQMNDGNKAVYYFRKSLANNPDNPSPANNLAVAYMSAGNFREAEKIFEEQLKKHPENTALKHNYRRALEEMGKK